MRSRKNRCKYNPGFKLKVALHSLQEATIRETCKLYSVSESSLYKWRKQLLQEGKGSFIEEETETSNYLNKWYFEEYDDLIKQLYQHIGKLEFQNMQLTKILNDVNDETKRQVLQKSKQRRRVLNGT